MKRVDLLLCYPICVWAVLSSMHSQPMNSVHLPGLKESLLPGSKVGQLVVLLLLVSMSAAISLVPSTSIMSYFISTKLDRSHLLFGVSQARHPSGDNAASCNSLIALSLTILVRWASVTSLGWLGVFYIWPGCFKVTVIQLQPMILLNYATTFINL